jgi:hypothetical protein
MFLSIECQFENHKFARGQTISGNCDTNIIGWPR